MSEITFLLAGSIKKGIQYCLCIILRFSLYVHLVICAVLGVIKDALKELSTELFLFAL